LETSQITALSLLQVNHKNATGLFFHIGQKFDGEKFGEIGKFYQITKMYLPNFVLKK